MRLYHALLVTAVALLASNVSAGQADCDMIPGDIIESSSGSVTQGSTTSSDVGSSQATQGSASSDTPVQQYSTTNSGASQPSSSSGSSPKDSFDGFDSSNDSPVQQGSAVDASQATQGSAPSDTPVQQFSTTNSGASQPASSSGSSPKDSFDGFDSSNDSPVQQGSAVDASQATQGSAPSDASFTSSFAGPTPDFPEYGQGSAPSDSPIQQGSAVDASQATQGSAPSDTPVQQFSTTNSGASQPASSSGSSPKDSFDGFDSSNDSPVQQGSAVDASQATQGSAPSDASFTSSFAGPTPDFPEYGQGSAPSDSPVQQGSAVGASQASQGSAPSDTPVQQFSTANSQGSAPSDYPIQEGSAPVDYPVQQGSSVGASQASQGSAPSDASFTSSFAGPTPDFPEYGQGSAPSDSPIQQGSAVDASQASQGSAPSDTPVQQFSTANSQGSAPSDYPIQEGSAPSDTPVQQYSTANSDVGASQANQGSAPSDSPVQQDSTANSNVGASQASASGPDDTKQGVVTPGGDASSSNDAAQKTDVAGESDINFSTTLAPKTTAAPKVASSSSGSSSSNSTITTSPSVGFCAKPRVRITEVDVGAAVENNEDEAALKVIAIAALPSGGSRIAFQSGDSVIVRELDANDKLVSSSTAVKVPLHDFGDIYADKDGFVIVGTRDAEGGGTLNCGNPSNMCGAPPSPAVPCYDMYMVRYDGTSEKWATKLTSSSASLPPYSSGKTGPDVYMIWWYAHHGRIAYDGTNWAAYFGAAISTSEGGCINIHQGDRMKVVSPSGTITDSKDSFDWGCSHSGYERITYDERSKSFASICKTDSNNRLMPPNNWDATIYPVNLAASDLGDIVPDSVATSNKYWSAVSNGDGDNAKVHLIHYDLKSAASEDIVLGGTDANERAPHLAPMGKDGMLAMWEGSSSGGDLQEGGDRTIYAQVLNRATGKTISEKITVDKSVVGNRYQALKSYPDGSVAYLSKGKTGTSVQVVRFFGC